MICFLILCLIATPVLADTRSDLFWQEFDITFWQTLPFASLMGYFVDRHLSSIMFPAAAAHWQAILPFAIVISAGNAFIHAGKRVESGKRKAESGERKAKSREQRDERTGDRH